MFNAHKKCRYIVKIFRRILNFFVVCILLLNFDQCKTPMEPPLIFPDEPVANAGADQNINIGSYILFDATKSTKGCGSKLIYTWTADSSNPEQSYLPNDSTGYTYVNTAGTYKFTLVVDNGIANSKPATLTVKVNPRVNTVFTDPHLEAEIRSFLKKQTGNLTVDDYLRVDSIRVGSHLLYKTKITSLGGIENCKNLKQLLASIQAITDVSPLASLTNLIRLDIDQNPDLIDISPVSTLTQLKHLDISATKVASLSGLSELVNLEYLNINLSDIKDLSPVTNFVKLKEFCGSNYDITDLSQFANLKELELLFLPFCKIQDINDIKNLTKLKHADLSANQISDIAPVSGLTNLITFKAANNNIKDISALKELINLNDIGLEQNLIEDIKPLADNAGLTNGCIIRLTGNPLNSDSQNEYLARLRAKGITVYW